MERLGDFLLAEVMLWLVYVIVVLAIAVTVFSAVRPFMVSPKKPSARGWLIMALTAVLLLVTYLLGSDQPMVINGTLFNDAQWLKTADMFIASSAILIIIAAAFVLYGVSGWNRKLTKK